MDSFQDAELDALIHAKAIRYEVPAELRERIGVSLMRPDAMQAFPQNEAKWAPWRRWRNMGIAFACGLIGSIAITWFLPRVDEQDRLTQEVVSAHVRSLMVAHLADVISTDEHTVKPWFSGKLDFSPPVVDLTKEGFPLVGGRLDYIGQRAVAGLVYQHRLHIINVFVWTSEGDLLQEAKTLNRQGFNLAHWKNSGMQFWAVSDLSSADLQRFAQLLRKQGAITPPG